MPSNRAKSSVGNLNFRHLVYAGKWLYENIALKTGAPSLGESGACGPLYESYRKQYYMTTKYIHLGSVVPLVFVSFCPLDDSSE